MKITADTNPFRHVYKDEEVEINFSTDIAVSVGEDFLQPCTREIARFGDLSAWFALEKNEIAEVIAQIWLVGKGEFTPYTYVDEIDHQDWILEIQALEQGLRVKAHMKYPGRHDAVSMEKIIGFGECASALTNLLIAMQYEPVESD